MHIHRIIKGRGLKPNLMTNHFGICATDEIIAKIMLHLYRSNSDITVGVGDIIQDVPTSTHSDIQSPNLSYSQMFLTAFMRGQILAEGGGGAATQFTQF